MLTHRANLDRRWVQPKSARWRATFGQSAIGQHDAGKAIRHFCDKAQANQRPPILTDERHVIEVKRLDPLSHPANMAGIAIVGFFGWLVRFAEANKIGRDNPKACRNDRPNHVAIQIAPAWLAMHHQHNRRIARPFIHIMHAQWRAI
jgi:hypothetical protein